MPLWSPCSYFMLSRSRLRLAAPRLLAFLCPWYCYISTSGGALIAISPVPSTAREASSGIRGQHERPPIAPPSLRFFGATKMLGCGATSTAPIRF